MTSSLFFKKNNKGYTLIEMVVVVGSLGIIIVAVISTILVTFRSQNKVKANNKTSENGRMILTELRRNIFNGTSKSIVCGLGGSSVSIADLNIGTTTTSLVCRNNNIASNSATLNSSEVIVYGCQNFVTCTNKAGTSEVATVKFSFGLSSITAGVGTSQMFDTIVTTRN